MDDNATILIQAAIKLTSRSKRTRGMDTNHVQEHHPEPVLRTQICVFHKKEENMKEGSRLTSTSTSLVGLDSRVGNRGLQFPVKGGNQTIQCATLFL
jgi:hypothetical protein